ncbi:MAG: hypothetical protein OXE99_02615, partial [Cellvibrionales bacterium]|nr:hypothetical protein [Cellvibrionales bacterium]
EGYAYLSELIVTAKFDDIEILRHHANPSTVPNGATLTNAFRQEKFKEFKSTLDQLEDFMINHYSNDESVQELLSHLSVKKSEKPLESLSEDEFIKLVGRESSEKLRSLFNEMRMTTVPGRSLADEFAEFSIRQSKGQEYQITAKDIEYFYLGSREISADVDTWGKAQKGTFGLHNYNYNMKIPPIKSNFATDAEYTKATEHFNRALVRQDQYDVFINYPIPPDLLSSGGVPSRLSKHFYEHLNTGFSQR